MGTTLDGFERAVSNTTATIDRVSPDDLEDRLAETVRVPAVGASLPPDTVSLEDVSVPIELDPTRAELLAATTGVTGAILGIASYGSVVLRATAGVDELASLVPDRHVVIVRESDVVPDMVTAFAELAPLFAEAADVVIATGASATADMGDLVHGVHGPREVHVLLVEGR